MGMHQKQEEHGEQIRELLGLRPGEPFFIMRAQDAISLETLQFYIDTANDIRSSDEFISDLENGEKKWRDWQDNNADIVKNPD